MHSHNLFDSVRGLFCVVEWDSRGVVMEDVVLDGAMEDIPADKTKVSVHGGCATAEERPGFTWIIWQLRVCML